MATRRVRITNHPDLPHELTAYDPETGEEIRRIRAISIEGKASHATEATITTLMPLVDLMADAEMRDLVWIEQSDGTLANVMSGEIRHWAPVETL
jgi:hypothetical protein